MIFLLNSDACSTTSAYWFPLLLQLPGTTHWPTSSLSLLTPLLTPSCWFPVPLLSTGHSFLIALKLPSRCPLTACPLSLRVSPTFIADECSTSSELGRSGTPALVVVLRRRRLQLLCTALYVERQTFPARYEEAYLARVKLFVRI